MQNRPELQNAIRESKRKFRVLEYFSDNSNNEESLCQASRNYSIIKITIHSLKIISPNSRLGQNQ